jgi:signal transduction histidine kinase/CheY-like chemotaxis protein
VRSLRTSLRHKLLFTMLLATSVAVLVALAAMIAYDLRAYHQSWLADVDAQGELLGRTTAAALTFDDPKTARDNLALLRFQPKVRAAAIYDKSRRLFASYAAKTEPEPPAEPAGDGLRTEAGSVLLVKPIVDQSGRLGTVYVRAQYELYDRLASYTGIALLVGLLAMGVALVVSNRLQRAVTQPILDISSVARDVVQQRNYAQRATRTSDDEVGALTDAFNNMLSEIERRTHELEAMNARAAQLNEDLERRVHERTKQLEEATDSAQKANRAKSEFLANMSHELRTPLNAVIGFGQLLKSSDIAASVEKRREFAEHVVAAGRHLLTLIDEILNLAQIESGKVSLSLEPVQIADVLADCRTMIGPMAESRGIRLNFPSELGLAAVADRTRLKQVLLNLLSNAVKYNRDNGAVTVTCTQHALARIRVSVQDTGVGLQATEVGALFQPFNRLGRELGSEEGTGIGLVVTKRLVEAMGGQIGVQSEPGVGSVFWFELAASVLAQPDPAVEYTRPAMLDTPHAAGQIATVLCVEDNPANMELLRQVLGQRPDLRLLTAADGRAGLQMAFEHRPDVIVLDNNMPNLTGGEAQAVLRSDPRTSAIPVIALTANAMPAAIATGLTAGFFRYLTKPVDIRQLLSAVSDALSSRRPDERDRTR